MADSRAAAIDAFLKGSAWRRARREPLPEDASFRRYVRLIGGPEPALLMDAPPPQEDVRPFVAVARHLVALGLSAPEIHAEDVADGLLIISDLGDDTFTRRLAAGADEAALYEAAVELLIALQRRADAAAIDLPPYDETRYLAEADLLVDWFLPAVSGSPTAPRVRAAYEDAWREVLPVTESVPTSLVLRDYHVDNLMWLPERHGVRRCGLLDFQDALIGPVAYDLVSLLEDARRDVDPALATRLTEAYLAAFPDIDRDAFAAAAAVLAAQRNSKIVGIFSRLSRRDGKDAYLGHIPRVWRLLERDLAHPALAPVRAWFERHAPARLRRAPEPASTAGATA